MNMLRGENIKSPEKPKDLLVIGGTLGFTALSLFFLAKGCGPAEYKPQCEPGMSYMTDGTESLDDIAEVAMQNTPNMTISHEIFMKELEYFNPGSATDTSLPENMLVIQPDCPTSSS